jgi:low affinity Fe/Cu permease
MKQEVLVRTSHLCSFDTTWTEQKMTPPTILLFLLVFFAQEHFYRAVSSNDRKDTHEDTETHVRDLSSAPLM